MHPGEILEVFSDSMCTQEGLPDAMSQLGHKVLKAEPMGDGLFRFLIRKK